MKAGNMYNIVLYIFFLLVLTVYILAKPLNDLDEIWNYNFARNIYEGAIPYVDFNMIPTPLAAYLAAVFLKLFGNNLFSFRILGILLAFFIFVLFFKLSVRMLKSKTFAFCATTYMLLLLLPYLSYDYNLLNLGLILLVICLEDTEKSRESLTGDIMTGLLIGLMPIVKQSTGAFVVLADMVFCWIDWRIYNKTRRWVLIRVICSFIPGFLFFVALVLDDSLNAFWDYAVRGIAYFDNKISYWDFMTISPANFMLGLSPPVIFGVSIWSLRNEKDKRKRRYRIMLLLFSVAGFSVVFPITDLIHFYIALPPLLICLFSSIKFKALNRKQGMFCNSFVIVVAVCVICLMLPSEEMEVCDLKHFEKIPIYPELEYQIAEVDGYISGMRQKGQEVYIADASAAVYMIPLDLYHKDFDMLSKGNTGSQSIEELLEGKEGVFLIQKDERHWNWQTNRELLYYIKDHYEYVEEVSCFYVYKTKENECVH